MFEEKASFRDPMAQVFTTGNGYRRLIHRPYFETYDLLMQSGLYDELVEAGLLVPHHEVKRDILAVTIEPETVPFISYPYEWCFSMLKQAALNTLEINRRAMKYGLMIKDASAYNMQYYEGNMALIDTTSFMQYGDRMPWGAYRQFLQHFVALLLLMAKVRPSLGRLSALFMDGVPLNLTSRLLPNRLHFSVPVLLHIYAQSLDVTVKGQRNVKMSPLAVYSLLNNLEGLVRGINYKVRSDWTNYGDAGSYTEQAHQDKRLAVRGLLGDTLAGSVCDLGANTGEYTDMAMYKEHNVIAVDSDHDCIEQMYQNFMGGPPLVVDLCNPSPAIGWQNTERKSFLDRLHVDTIMALALIHHLCIGNNTPLHLVAEMMSGHCKNLIIEFVPPEDKQAQKLLNKKNIPPYSLDIFKAEFSRYFAIKAEYQIADSLRTLYLMEKK